MDQREPNRGANRLLERLDRLHADLITRFGNIVGLAKIENKDRNTTAVTQYQMKIETAALIRAAEELQSLIRQMQEMWLFGQLNTIGDSKVQHQTDEKAREVAELLQQLLSRQPAAAAQAA